MLIGSFIFTIGAVINGFSQTSLMLIIGRGILGLGIGKALSLIPCGARPGRDRTVAGFITAYAISAYSINP
jgi:MFS family permease